MALAAAVLILTAQLAVLLIHSHRQYQRFDLSLDFAIFHQAWFQIAHGHLDPRLTANPGLGHPASYWRSHFELVMWPVAALYWLSPNDGLTLLVLQDLSIVVAETVALWWLFRLTLLRRLPQWLGAAAIAATAVLGAVNPWLYGAAQQDFHFEAVASCFCLIAAYQMWSGRPIRCWLFVALTLMCGDVSATYLIGVGVAFAIASPRVRSLALGMAAVGVGWMLLVATLGANQGSPIGAYAYLAGHPISNGASGIVAVAKGIVTHPSRLIDRIVESRQSVLRLLQPSGIVGIVNPWTGGTVVLVLLENVLNPYAAYRHPHFQNFPVYIFATAGTGLLVPLFAERSFRRQVLAGVILVTALVSGLVFDIGRHEYGVFRSSVAAGTELQMVRARIPANAEVISSFGVVGRFAGRRSVYSFISGGNTVPIDEPVVVIVLAPAVGNDPTPPSVSASLKAMALNQYHARVILNGTRVSAYEWVPSPNQGSLTIP